MQLAAIIREQVHAREWDRGMRIPSEHALMKTYGLSRGTVRRAIEVLVTEGMLVQQHGRGTFVAEPGVCHAAGDKPLSFAEGLLMQGMRFKTHVIDKRVLGAPADVAVELGIETGDAVMFMRRVRTVKKVPVICQESWTNMMACEGIDDTDFEKESLFDAVERTSGRRISHSRMRYQAMLAGREHGALLDCEEMAPVLLLEQNIYLENGTAIEWSSTWLKPGQSIIGTGFLPPAPEKRKVVRKKA